MKNSQEFKIKLIGISENDRRMLERVLNITDGATRSYGITDDVDAIENTVLIVNSDENNILQTWSKRYLNDSKVPTVPTIFAGKRLVKGNGLYNIPLPFRATQLLTILDEITVKELNYIPELTIGAESVGSEITQEMLEKFANSRSGGATNFKAMVVDDSQPVRKQLEIELKMLGAAVEVAENGEKAIQLSKDHAFDIIFLDVMMPGIDGYKVCKYLKKDIKSKNIPVIMLTGKSSPFDKVKGSLSGCDTYLTKPLQHEEFQHVARKFIPQMNA